MRTHGLVLVGVLAAVAACEGRHETTPEAPPPPAAKAPKRTAVADQDLRQMLTDVAAEKACTMFRGVFRGLRDAKRPSVATGVLWIRGCKITRDGTRVVFRLSGDGWQWAEDKSKKAGATFAVAQDVRFSAEVTIPGALDLAYDPKTHVASILFTPSETPEVEFTPRGEIEVDREGTWSSVLGALSTAIGDAPEEQAEDQAETTGTQQFTKSFADGLSFTLDLCTGYGRFGLGRPAQGKMAPPDVGESRAVDVELHPKSVLLFGPQPADKGYTARIRARGGAVRAELMCAEQAEKLALAYAERADRPSVKTLASKVIAGEGTIAIERAACPVVIVARSVAPAPVRLDWKRPAREIALGPLVACDQ
jgi:hypothetical protein